MVTPGTALLFPYSQFLKDDSTHSDIQNSTGQGAEQPKLFEVCHA